MRPRSVAVDARNGNRPDKRRCVPVRLTDLEPNVRWQAAVRACKAEPDPDERARIFLAALNPSSTVYFVAA
jgi:hypothetical protein